MFEKILMTLLCDNLNHTDSGMKGQNAAGKKSKSWDLEISVSTTDFESRIALFSYFHEAPQVLSSLKLSQENIAMKNYLALLLLIIKNHNTALQVINVETSLTGNC